MGFTGAGKSSIINLLCRFYDVTGGAISLDSIDVRNWDLTALRRSIAVVMQDVFLFSTL
ncbi:MAG: ATP-binding cassette domain-containing protein [Clostridia bacterium]